MEENKPAEDRQPQVEYYDVLRAAYETHYSNRAPDKPPTLQITYFVEGGRRLREWVCPEHKGFAREKFESWWKWKSVIAPPTATETAERYANGGALAAPTKIKVTRTPGDNFPRIEWVEFSSIPNFKPVDAISQDDWNVGKNEQEGFEEFAQFDDGPDRCGQCKFWTNALHINDGEIEDGGFCIYTDQRVSFYETACCKFEKNDDDIPF